MTWVLVALGGVAFGWLVSKVIYDFVGFAAKSMNNDDQNH